MMTKTAQKTIEEKAMNLFNSYSTELTIKRFESVQFIKYKHVKETMEDMIEHETRKEQEIKYIVSEIKQYHPNLEHDINNHLNGL